MLGCWQVEYEDGAMMIQLPAYICVFVSYCHLNCTNPKRFQLFSRNVTFTLENNEWIVFNEHCSSPLRRDGSVCDALWAEMYVTDDGVTNSQKSYVL